MNCVCWMILPTSEEKECWSLIALFICFICLFLLIFFLLPIPFIFILGETKFLKRAFFKSIITNQRKLKLPLGHCSQCLHQIFLHLYFPPSKNIKLPQQTSYFSSYSLFIFIFLHRFPELPKLARDVSFFLLYEFLCFSVCGTEEPLAVESVCVPKR